MRKIYFVLLLMALLMFAGCSDLPKSDTTNLTGQGRNYIYFDCSTDTANVMSNNQEQRGDY